MNGYLVLFPWVTVWIQGATSHRNARERAIFRLRDSTGHTLEPSGSVRVVNGKPGPRRPA